MKTEYGVMDNDGQLFGLPARTFVSQEAAAGTLRYLESRRDAMRDNDVEQWLLEKDRTYTIVRRQVGAWEAVDT